MPITLSQAFLIARRLREAALSRSLTMPLEPPLLPSEMSVFGFLAQTGKSALVSEIVSATGLAQSQVSVMVRRLQKRGWVSLATPAEDRRATSVRIVEEIHRQMKSFLGRQDEAVIGQLTQGLRADDKDSVTRGLTILARHLEQQNQNPNTQ